MSSVALWTHLDHTAAVGQLWGGLPLHEHLRSRGTIYTLQWRHNGRDGVSNHKPHDCLLNRLFRRRSKKISRLRVTGLCVGNSPVTGEFPAKRASNAQNVSIWWRHHEFTPLIIHRVLAWYYWHGSSEIRHVARQLLRGLLTIHSVWQWSLCNSFQWSSSIRKCNRTNVE